MIRFIHAFLQVLFLFAFRLVFGLFVRRTTYPSLGGFEPGKKTIIVSNHQKAIDPFLVCIFLPLNVFFKLVPFCYIVHYVFYDSPLKPLLWAAGCFPTKNPKKEHAKSGIDSSLSFINKGYTLMIFPEGTRVKNEPVRIRTGVEVIASQLNEPLQYVTARVTYGLSKINISYGRVDKQPVTAAELMEEVYKL